jgi:hypothetical protein
VLVYWAWDINLVTYSFNLLGQRTSVFDDNQ